MGRPVSAQEELTRGRVVYDSTVFSSKKPGSNPGSLEEKSMSPLQRRCLCSTAIPIALGFGFAAVTGPGMGFTAVAHAQSANPCSPSPCAPCGAAPAGATDCGVPRLQQAQINPCAATNPCAAAANSCNPCAVKKKPCAAAATQCAAQKPCASANPCAAKIGRASVR